ncbi:MAG TPA: flagellar hook-basal body complex protein FliE [Arenibaculum sp.]|nr:flagellar hook-basal body complex protein FliE [Arenibaculum sp.]
MIDFSIGKVAAAYASNRSAMPSAPIEAPGGIGPSAAVAAVPDDSFGAFIDDQLTRAVGTIQHGESASLAAVAGKASAQEVVQSVIAAEMTIQTVVAIRDKMVQAYQEIMRMPI